MCGAVHIAAIVPVMLADVHRHSLHERGHSCTPPPPRAAYQKQEDDVAARSPPTAE